MLPPASLFLGVPMNIIVKSNRGDRMREVQRRVRKNIMDRGLQSAARREREEAAEVKSSQEVARENRTSKGCMRYAGSIAPTVFHDAIRRHGEGILRDKKAVQELLSACGNKTRI